MRQAMLAVFVVSLVGCSSTHNLGMMALGSGDPASVISASRQYSDLGPVEGQSCRYFVLAIIPFGDSTPNAAMEDALAEVGGDAILNASITTSLYGFVPYFNVLSFTCTTVRGVAVRIE